MYTWMYCSVIPRIRPISPFAYFETILRNVNLPLHTAQISLFAYFVYFMYMTMKPHPCNKLWVCYLANDMSDNQLPPPKAAHPSLIVSLTCESLQVCMAILKLLSTVSFPKLHVKSTSSHEKVISPWWKQVLKLTKHTCLPTTLSYLIVSAAGPSWPFLKSFGRLSWSK